MAFDLGFFSSQREANSRSSVSRTLATATIVAACLASADAFTVSPLASSRSFAPAAQSANSQLLARSSVSLRPLQGNKNELCAKLRFVTQLRASAKAPAKSEKMYEIAQENFARWNEALQEKSFEKTAALYSKTDLSFLPTVSPEHIKDPVKTEQYFVDFIKKSPAGEITDDNVQTLNEDSYLHTGMYTFMTGPENDRRPVNARFSYLWKKVQGDWKIFHHHSSVVPGAAAPAPKDDDMYPVAQANFNKWNEALVAKDYAKVASLYSSTDLSFLPTVSPKFIRDKHSTKQYFVDFIKKLPEGTITSDKVQAYGSDAYLHTGMYTFLTGPENARVPVEARFSYMWRMIEGDWKIVHHHSSAVPKAPEPEAAKVETESEVMYPIAQENFARWNDALVEKNYEKVASLYSTKELSFLPTVSPEFIRDGHKTKDYFVEFVKKQPSGTITADDVQSYGPDAYLHSGMYTFMTGPEDDRQPVSARFSYMWRKVQGDWKIVHHHSSAVPGAAPAPKPETPPEDMYAVAQANFQAWNDGLKEKCYDTVAGMYCTEELSFLPTVSPKFIRDGPSTKEYFVNFLQKLPDGTITADDVQPYGDDAYLHSGLYTFMTGPEDDRQPVNARFSYMWKRKDGQWKIVHHHSSALPAGADGPTDVAEDVPEFDLTTAEDNVDTSVEGDLEIAPSASLEALEVKLKEMVAKKKAAKEEVDLIEDDAANLKKRKV